MNINSLSMLCFAFQSAFIATISPAQTLWYQQPATNWQTEALPIGNGSLGAMIFGNEAQERIMFNEDSLWIGDENDTGSYQSFGDVFVHFQPTGRRVDGISDGDKDASAYRRELDIGTAVHQTRYTKDGIRYRREAFASHPAGVMVFRYTADQAGAHSGSVELTDNHEGSIVVDGNTITATGSLAGYEYGKAERQTPPPYAIALDYQSRVMVLHEGGRVTTANGRIEFAECDALTILVAAGTDYVNQRELGWKGPHPRDRIAKILSEASQRNYSQLHAEHIADYQKLYQRFSIELPGNSNSDLPTNERLLAYQNDASDQAFESLMVQYARYLMISCSRPGSLPANLQGLWNDSNNPPWRSDYHSDVNVQMNYWFVDQTNLSECFEPYSEYQHSVRAVRRDVTAAKYGVRGWATRSENGIFGGSSYLWVPGDAAWLAQNLWDHYAYTRDKQYLRTRAYPIIKELCQFWEDYLIEVPGSTESPGDGSKGKLVSPASVSPEHGPESIGNSYEQQLVYDLFTNFIEGSTDLDVDHEYRAVVMELRSRLLAPQIGRWGQLQEWMQDIDDPKDQHRHLSHLIAVYPGRQIAPSITPELAQAAAVSLDARGDSGTGWSIGWKISLWARLLNGDRAHRILQNSLKPCTTTEIVMNYAGGTYPNLLMAHPPFQIEANFGYAAGFCELLIQSHLGELHLLPALPTAWPDGEVRGLKARGNYEIDFAWEKSELKSAVIRSPLSTVPKIRIAGSDHVIAPDDDSRIRWIEGS